MLRIFFLPSLIFNYLLQLFTFLVNPVFLKGVRENSSSLLCPCFLLPEATTQKSSRGFLDYLSLKFSIRSLLFLNILILDIIYYFSIINVKLQLFLTCPPMSSSQFSQCSYSLYLVRWLFHVHIIIAYLSYVLYKIHNFYVP